MSVPHVIGLFPGLLPAELRETITYPFHVPRLDGSALDNALHSLIGYLMEVRNNLLSKSATKIPVVSSVGTSSRLIQGGEGGGSVCVGVVDVVANVLFVEGVV